MSRIHWEVTGRSPEGGIVVREGEALSSKQEPMRLGTGSIIRQIRLVGDRLQFERVSGIGPVSGWVSVKVKGQDLVERTAKPCRLLPIVMCFYSVVNARQGRTLLRFLMSFLRMGGLPDFVIGDHIDEEGYSDCKDFDDYTTRLASKISEDPAHHGRPVFIIGHGHGCLPAWGTAQKLGKRCLKLYLMCRRAPNVALLDEVFGIDSTDKVDGLDDCKVFNDMREAWPNDYFEVLRDQSDRSSHPGLSEGGRNAMKIVKRILGSTVCPSGSRDLHLICEGQKAIRAPIMALAAGKEAKKRKGETLAKLLPWKDFTRKSESFQLVFVPGVDNMSILWANSPAFSIILDDMRKRLGRSAWIQEEARWLSDVAPELG